jgi:hypothetical protein
MHQSICSTPHRTNAHPAAPVHATPTMEEKKDADDDDDDDDGAYGRDLSNRH